MVTYSLSYPKSRDAIASKKGPTDENVVISYLIVIVKFVFFKISNYFGKKPNFTDFIN